MDRPGSSAPIGGIPSPQLEEAAERLVVEALEEARTEVKEILKERLLEAAMRRLGGPVGAAEDPASRSMGSDIDATVRAIAEATEDRSPSNTDPDARRGSGERSVYVFGVTRPGRSVPGEPGIDPTAPVEAVELDGIQAITCRVPLSDFDEASLERNLGDVSWLGERVLVHERVLTRAMESGTVLPLRFGTIFRDEEHLRRGLEAHRGLFVEALERLDRRAEWEVKVVCRPDAFRSRVEERSERVTALGPGVGAGEGEAFMQRKRMERVVAEETRRIADRIAREIAGALAVHADDTAPGAAGGPTDGWVVLRTDAYLVPDAQRAAFRGAIDELESRFADWSVELRVAGPLPPYRFTSIDLRERADA